MAKNHDLFNTAALFILGEAYESFPIPSPIERSKVMDAMSLVGERDQASLVLSYAVNYLQNNGYIDLQTGTPRASDGKELSGWRVVLRDKGLVALRRPTLENPEETLGDKIKRWSGAAATAGAKEGGKAIAKHLFEQVLTAAPWSGSGTGGGFDPGTFV